MPLRRVNEECLKKDMEKTILNKMKHKIIKNWYVREISGKSKGCCFNYWFILAIILCLVFWLITTLFLLKSWHTGVKKLELYQYQPDYSLFTCPDGIEEAECHLHLDVAATNGFDPQEYVDAIFNRRNK